MANATPEQSGYQFLATFGNIFAFFLLFYYRCTTTCTGFILNLENLENLENRQFFAKCQGKPGIVRELFIIFIQVREKSGKTKYPVYISFSLTIGIVVREVVALSVASECELYHLAL